VPVIAPDPELNVSPPGNEGEIAKLVIGPPVFVTTVAVIATPISTVCVAPVVIEIIGGAAVTVNLKVAVDVPSLGPVAVTV